jgi:hypothetical protein
MEKIVQNNLHVRGNITQNILAGGMGWGLMGGLVATLVMDIVLMAVLSVTGLPAITCFLIVGNTIARFFSMMGVEITGGVQLGVAGHYLIGPALGAIFGVIVDQIGMLRLDTTKKLVVLAIVYIEIVSQPILAMTPLLLKMTASETVQWFGESFVMHLMWGIVLGIVVSRRPRLTTVVNP